MAHSVYYLLAFHLCGQQSDVLSTKTFLRTTFTVFDEQVGTGTLRPFIFPDRGSYCLPLNPAVPEEFGDFPGSLVRLDIQQCLLVFKSNKKQTKANKRCI
jgi:hypothetical protein